MADPTGGVIENSKIDSEQLSVDENPEINASDNILDKLSELQKVELQKQIEIDWQVSNASRIKWMNDRQEGLQLYWGIRRPKDFPFRNAANIHVPLIRTILDTVHSNIISSFDFRKPVSILPVGPEDVPKARKVEQLLNWQFTSQLDYRDIVDRGTHSAFLYGFAPIKLRYVIERMGKKKIFDGLKADILAPERFYTPPDAVNADVNQMDYVIHEISMSKSDLKKRMQAGVYAYVSDEDLGRIGENVTKHRRYFDDFFEVLRTTYSGIESVNISSQDRKTLTLVEYFGNYDYDGDGISEPIMAVWLKDQRKLIKVIKWERRRPFVLIEFSYILNRSHGESIPEILKQVNQELNMIHNQRIDAVTITNIPFFFFDPVAGFNPDEIKLAPGVGIPVNGSPSQAVYFPAMNTTHPEMYREEENLFEYAERLFGAGANTQGVMQSKRTSATEIATIDRRANIQFLKILNRLQKGFEDFAMLALEYDKEYMPKEIQARITGLDSQEPIFETIKLDELEGRYDINANCNSVLDDQADKQEFFSAYQLGMQNPLIMRDENAMYELTKDLFDKLGLKRSDSYLHKPDDQIPKNPQEEHNLFMQEEYVRPHLSENIDEHLQSHAEMINSPSFKLLSKKGQMLLMKHYQATLKMQQGLQQMQTIQKMQGINSELMQLHMGVHPMQQAMQQNQQPQNGKGPKQQKQPGAAQQNAQAQMGPLANGDASAQQ